MSMNYTPGIHGLRQLPALTDFDPELRGAPLMRGKRVSDDDNHKSVPVYRLLQTDEPGFPEL